MGALLDRFSSTSSRARIFAQDRGCEGHRVSSLGRKVVGARSCWGPEQIVSPWAYLRQVLSAQIVLDWVEVFLPALQGLGEGVCTGYGLWGQCSLPSSWGWQDRDSLFHSPRRVDPCRLSGGWSGSGTGFGA